MRGRRSRPLISAASVVVAMACCLYAELSAQTIQGALLEQGTDRPVDLAVVTLLTLDGDSVSSVLTDDNGRFTLSSPEPGDFLLAATAWGYERTVAKSVFSLPAGSRMSLQFRIPRAALELPGLTVDIESLFRQPKLVTNGFVDRARMGFGTFITPRQIEESKAYSTSDLLARTGRILTEYAPGGDRIQMRGALGLCTPFVYLDGVRVSLDETSLDMFIPLPVLEAVEVYRSAVEAPPQYAVGVWRCGVILLWTKS